MCITRGRRDPGGIVLGGPATEPGAPVIIMIIAQIIIIIMIIATLIIISIISTV